MSVAIYDMHQAIGFAGGDWGDASEVFNLRGSIMPEVVPGPGLLQHGRKFFLRGVGA